MDQDLIRIHLIKILSLGMKLSAIAERTKINAIDLSRFKNGAKAFETAEYETLESLDLFTN